MYLLSLEVAGEWLSVASSEFVCSRGHDVATNDIHQIYSVEAITMLPSERSADLLGKPALARTDDEQVVVECRNLAWAKQVEQLGGQRRPGRQGLDTTSLNGSQIRGLGHPVPASPWQSWSYALIYWNVAATHSVAAVMSRWIYSIVVSTLPKISQLPS